jgi:hypothetical protein
LENKKKYPDNVVWSEDRGAPAIIPEDVSSWKNEKILKANSYYKRKFDELLDEYRKLQEELEWNRIVYSSNYSFQPIPGEEYHLYLRESGETFLSIINPLEWDQKYIGTFIMDSDNKWRRKN